ncbi:MAG TPA: hypothetical protein V6D17_09405 [Candidatus Obscuribacterales bacterium]
MSALSTGIGSSAKASYVALDQLSYDMRRMLKIQFKEFIHHIEDTEFDLIKSSHENSVGGPVSSQSCPPDSGLFGHLAGIARMFVA